MVEVELIGPELHMETYRKFCYFNQHQHFCMHMKEVEQREREVGYARVFLPYSICGNLKFRHTKS